MSSASNEIEQLLEDKRKLIQALTDIRKECHAGVGGQYLIIRMVDAALESIRSK